MSNEPSQTTAPGQLWHLLNSIDFVKRDTFTVYNGENIDRVPAKDFSLFGLTKRLNGTVDNYIKMLLLLEQTESELDNVGIHKSMLSQFQEIKEEITAVGKELKDSKILDQKNFDYLHLLHNLIVKTMPQTDQKSLERVKNRANSLFDDIKKMSDEEIDEDLRKFLLEHISNMKQAIDAYFIYGPEGIEQVVSTFVGQTLMKPELNKKLEASSIKKALRAFLASLVGFTSFAADAITLKEGLPLIIEMVQEPEEPKALPPSKPELEDSKDQPEESNANKVDI